MPRRAAGYHYALGRDGKKHRVYANRKIRANPAGGVVMRGKGGYYNSAPVKFLKKWVPSGTFRTIGKVGGGVGGALVGGLPSYGLAAGPVGAIGAGLGSIAGGLASRILGFGSYTVKKNSIISEGQSPASMHSTNNKIVVRHREYICDIVSSDTANGFNLQSFSLNPGLFETFPWLSAIAQQYEEWRPRGIVMEYKTLSADAVASGQANFAIGGVIMATDYNAVNTAFTNKQQMDNTQYTTSDKPSCSFYHAVECQPGSNPISTLYVRGSAAFPANSDPRMYDLGNFQIATFGVAATSVVLGELWATYEIELAKPISVAQAGDDLLMDVYKCEGTIANTAPFGSSQYLLPNSTLNGAIITNNTYTFPTAAVGSYMVFWESHGPTPGACGTFTLTTTNFTLSPNLFQNGNTVMTTLNTATDTSYVFFACFTGQVVAPNASFQIAISGPPGGTTAGCTLIVTQVTNDIVLSLSDSLAKSKKGRVEEVPEDDVQVHTANVTADEPSSVDSASISVPAAQSSVKQPIKQIHTVQFKK